MPKIAAWLAIGLFAGVVAMLAGLVAFAVRTPQPAQPLLLISTPESTQSAPASRPEIKVYVAGGVANPGVYVLRRGDRVDDAIRAAGGLAPDGDPERVNLAAPVADGQEVMVPRRGDPTPSPPGRRGPVATTASPAMVNLNTATADELRKALGISATTAQRIVDYRQQHGPYARTDDVVKAGMRKATFDRIKDRLTL